MNDKKCTAPEWELTLEYRARLYKQNRMDVYNFGSYDRRGERATRDLLKESIAL